MAKDNPMNKPIQKPEPGSPLGESFSEIYTRLTINGWPMDIAWREALARVQWLEDHEQREQETKQEEKST